MKYPDTVVGAIASSAPVQAELDFVEYLQVVSASLSTSTSGECVGKSCSASPGHWLSPAGLACDLAIRNATTTLSAMLQDKSLWPAVEKIFK